MVLAIPLKGPLCEVRRQGQTCVDTFNQTYLLCSEIAPLAWIVAVCLFETKDHKELRVIASYHPLAHLLCHCFILCSLKALCRPQLRT